MLVWVLIKILFYIVKNAFLMGYRKNKHKRYQISTKIFNYFFQDYQIRNKALIVK